MIGTEATNASQPSALDRRGGGAQAAQRAMTRIDLTNDYAGTAVVPRARSHRNCRSCAARYRPIPKPKLVSRLSTK